MNRKSTFAARTMKSVALALFALMIVVVCSDLALACPTCKDNLASDPAAANLVRGYFYSILFMMSMPFTILFCLCALFYWEVRKARFKQAQAAALAATQLAEETTTPADTAGHLASV